MYIRELLLSLILLSTGVSCINAFLVPLPHTHVVASRHTPPNFNTLPVQMLMDDNDDQKGVSESDNFDAAGFGNYLAPYLLAFLVSIGITFAFVKFVLMDY